MLAAAERALGAAESFLAAARAKLIAEVAPDGVVDLERFDSCQLAGHAVAWAAASVEGLRQIGAWARRLDDGAAFGPAEALILETAYGEYLAQLAGGIPMAQGEFARPQDLGLADAETAPLRAGDAGAMAAALPQARLRLGALLAETGEGGFGRIGLDDATLDMIRDQMRRFAERAVMPSAQDWHRRDQLIPLPLIEELAGIGVFGLTIPEEYGGLGLGKAAMCVVSEELSRAYLGVGSLGTRSEIAGELIRLNGTPAQKSHWLPGIASGAVLPTAVFTEPGAGSDLAAVATRAVREDDTYRIYGAKTWITHGARSDLMTLLARTDGGGRGYRGLSMFLAAKPRGSDADPFPAPGISGTEIPVLGYRGMKEYEIAFDGFAVPAENLLGAVEGQGFKQLMATFESARIQTASRAVGVAQNALELGLAYALERRQFGKPLAAFPRVAGKLALMAMETMVARQLTYFAAREKDRGRRCDVEAGMAKLLAARAAWSNADNALQIHGGNGYALEFPISRVLCDARILNIFEGAAEIQAQIIARGLIAGRN
ncbi:MAG TPA: acyl-CoA dehydrogenase family protein [Stellaceae bacterium]|nr:acyl-CoA dehydrogenase family protein [Stellaceae bacterium]